MGIFSFSQRKTSLNWKKLEDMQQLENLLTIKDGVARVFFKHSTRCSISSMALNTFESGWELEDENLYYIDLLRFRDVSNALSEKTGIVHQSPQTIIILNGEVIYHASHSGIDSRAIQQIIKQA